MILLEVDAIVLTRCHRVCRSWNHTIQGTSNLRENLFIQPRYPSVPGPAYLEPVIVNPVMKKYFAAIFPTIPFELPNGAFALELRLCTYEDLAAFPWAPPDQTTLNYPTTLAFMRKETSWRRMYLTQHPIQWIDWWHEWDTEGCTSDTSEDTPTMTGHCNARRNDGYITLGTLWDIIEARLLRVCYLQAFMYPNGCPWLDDRAVPAKRQARGRRIASFLPDSGRTNAKSHYSYMPRIGIRTYHHWPVIPLQRQHFGVQRSCWRAEGSPLPAHPTIEDCQIPRGHHGDGGYWLNEDCKRDREEHNKRWSRSEACGDSSMSITDSRGGSQYRLRQILRLQRRELRRQQMFAQARGSPSP
jgi:hypothetical protein